MNISHTSLQRGAGVLVALSVLSFRVVMIGRTPWLEKTVLEPAQTVDGIGTLLMMKYLLPFEVASLLLLGALIGAAMLSRNVD